MTDEEVAILKHLGDKLRFYRIQKGYSQEVFADKTELDRTYISGLERGKRNPSYLIIKRIANTLDIQEQQLFQDEVKK